MAVFVGLLLSPWCLASSFEIETLGDKHHVTADRTLYHSREKVYEAFGHVVVSSHGRRLSCEYLWFDENTREAKARGNVIFVTANSSIEAAELDFNLDTGLGAIFYGKVYNDLYTLRGQLIRRVEPDRYLTTDGEYTTCKDCSESWKVSARNVDLTMDGYAFMDSVFIKIKDVSALYLPYLVMPVKNRRQSGLLFPRMGATSNHGFVFVQPLFLAFDDHQDATFSVGRYSARGMRYEGEYRYKSYNGIAGSINYFHTVDRKVNHDWRHRSAIRSENEWPFFRNFGMRWRVLEVSDRDYPLDFQEDISGVGLPDLESNVVMQAPFQDFFVSAEVKRYRNLLYDQPKGFDTGMVQDAPALYGGLKDRTLFGPLLFSAYGRYDNFTRQNGPFFDRNGNNLFDPSSNNPERIRTARRSIFSPEVSVPFALGPYLSLAPSAQYNNIHYNFSLPTENRNMGATTTQYMQWKVEASTTLKRVYDYNGEKVSKLGHQLTPFVTFSNIPWISRDDNNLFQKQLALSNGAFDEFDIVPMSNNSNFLRIPQGKSLYYGVTSRLVRKLRRPEEAPRAYPYDLLPAKSDKRYPPPQNRKQELVQERDRLFDEHDPHYETYQEIWNVNLSQAYDFKDAQAHQEDKLRAFSYFMAKSSFNVESLTHDLEYRFYPRMVKRYDYVPGQTQVPPANGVVEEMAKDRHWVTTSLTWYWVKLMNLRRTRLFERSIKLNFSAIPKLDPSGSRTVGGALSWSFSDFVNLKIEHNYDMVSLHTINWGAVATLTHPSECWGMVLRYDWNRARGSSGSNSKPNELGFELLLNLTGTGFMGASQVGKEGGPSGVFGGI